MPILAYKYNKLQYGYEFIIFMLSHVSERGPDNDKKDPWLVYIGRTKFGHLRVICMYSYELQAALEMFW